jgi:hypothetical protein
MSGWEGDAGMAQDGKISRVNKLKRDKQQMRKLLRVLLVWGKNFKGEKKRRPWCTILTELPYWFLKSCA